MRLVLVFIFFVPLLVGLGACLPPKQETGSAEVVTPAIVPTPGLTPRDRNLLALELLNDGKSEKARVELGASLAELPADRNALAQNLIAQIDGDPEAMLGSKSFTYKVQRGESMSIIADKYLGDKFKFFILARYNGLDNPSQLRVGEVIKVPGDKPADIAEIPDEPEAGPPSTQPPAAEPETPPSKAGESAPSEGGDSPVAAADEPQTQTGEGGTPPAQTGEGGTPPAEPETQVANVAPSQTAISDTEKIQTLLTTADEKANAGQFPEAIKIIETGLAEFPNESIVKQFAAGTYVKFGASLREQHDYQQAFSAVERAAVLDPENDAISRLLDEAKKAARADGLYQDGRKYEKADAKIDALQSYQAALKVWPEHDPAQMALAKVVPEVADIYYREAKTAFQRQDLETALKYYDKTLEVDPNHEPAKLERQRTIQLQKNLAGQNQG